MKTVRRWLRRLARWIWRGSSHLLVSVLLLVFVLWLCLYLAAGSSAGTRWLLEKVASLRTPIRFEVAGGTLRDGIRLRHFRFQGKKFHLDAQSLELRLTWASLLAGELYVDDLTAKGVRLVFTGPPNPGRVNLKHPRLPIRLVLAQGRLDDIAVVKKSGTLAADSLSLQGAEWVLQHLRVPNVELAHPRFHLRLGGALDFDGDYPIKAEGSLRAAFLSSHHLRPLRARIGGNLAALQVNLLHRRPLPVEMIATLDALAPRQDYQGLLRWGRMDFPWFSALQIQTRDGMLHFRGNRQGLALVGGGRLGAIMLPQGDYRLAATTDWHTLTLAPLEARTLMGGLLRVAGDVGWRDRPHWRIESRWSGVDLSRFQPAAKPFLPVLSGKLSTEGYATARDSSVRFKAAWNSSETWEGLLRGQTYPWRWREDQQLDLGWQNLSRHVPGLGPAESTAGSLQYRGSPTRFQLDTALAMRSERTPAGDWRLTGQGSRSGFRSDFFQYQGEAGAATGSAEASWRPGRVEWSASLGLDAFRNDFWVPDWPAVLSGRLAADGVVASGRQDIRLRDMGLSGTLKAQPFATQGSLQLALSPGRRYPDFQGQSLLLDWGPDHLAVEGGLRDGQWDLTLDAALADLTLVDARLSGSLGGVVQLQGAENQPAIGLNLYGEKLQVAGLGAQTLSVSGYLPALAEENGFLQVHGHEVTAAGRVVPDLMLVAEGTRPAHRISWQVDAAPLAAEGYLDGGLVTGPGGQPGWAGASLDSLFSLDNFRWQQQEGPVNVAWSGDSRQLTLGAHCWQAEAARFCNREELQAGPDSARARLGLEGLEISRLSLLFPEGLAWNGSLEGEAALDWKNGQKPQLGLQLTTRKGGIGLEQEDDEPLTLPYDRLALKVVTEDDRLRFRFETEAPHIGQGYIESWLDPYSKPYQINGALVLERVNLAIFKPFFPGMGHLSGEMNLAGGLSGSITGPDFYGDFSLNSAEVAARDAPLDLKQINLSAAIRGREAGIEGSFLSGGGRARLDGKAEWKGEPSLALKLVGKDLALRQKPLISALVDPDLRIAVKPYEVDIRGQVAVPQALLRPQALSDKAVPLSPDVRVIDEARKARARVAKSMKQWSVNADIELLLKDKVQFEGFGMNSFMTGQLRLQQQRQRGLQATGEIELNTTGDKEARYEAYGQKLKIRKGQLLFAGPVTQPGLNIEAVKTIEDKVVGVRVEGRANAPTVQLFADTAMTQDEMLGYLLIGRPLYQEGRLNVGGGNDTALLTSAALSLGIRSGQGIASDIGSLVGIKDVALDAEGSGDETQFTVSGYLSPRLYLRYGVGVFTPVSKVTLRYKINQSLYLEAVSSLENALDLFYNIKY